jgi:hypothetical protein
VSDSLNWSKDFETMNKVSSYIYDELQHCGSFWTFWKWRRWYRLGVTHDVLHEVWKELRARGELRSATMFSEPEDPAVKPVKV